MTSLLWSISKLSDGDLLAQVKRAAVQERHATAQLIALLMEVDARKLYAEQGARRCSRIACRCFTFQSMLRICASRRARTAQRFPVILERLSDGSLHLTAVSLLGSISRQQIISTSSIPPSTRVNAKWNCIARLRPQPDVPAVVRKLPVPKSLAIPPAASATERPRGARILAGVARVALDDSSSRHQAARA